MTQVRRQYRVGSASVDEINFVFRQLSDRLDQMEGFRGIPQFQADVDFNNQKGINADSGTADADLAITGQLDIGIALAVAQAKNEIFPVGSIYLTTVSTNPGTLIGCGTWAALGTGQLHIGTGAGGAGLVGSYGTDIENILEPRTLVYIWQRSA